MLVSLDENSMRDNQRTCKYKTEGVIRRGGCYLPCSLEWILEMIVMGSLMFNI